jgi:prepilin-type N-terminal cleavage/methylation domain-containing protein
MEGSTHHVVDGRLRRRRARAGFTLLELIVVLTIAGIIAGAAVPRIDYDRYRVDAGGRRVRAALQSAQRFAIMRQTNVVVMFDTAGRQMRVLEDVNNNYQADAGERITVRPLEDGARFAGPPAALSGVAGTRQVNGNNLSTVNGFPAIAFLRDGAASSDISIYVTAGRGSPKHFRAVRVIQATGRANLWRYVGSTWMRGSA